MEKIKEIPAPKSNLVRSNEAKSMDISADGQFLLMGCLDNATRLWHVQYDGALLTFVVEHYPVFKFTVFSASGDYIIEVYRETDGSGHFILQSGTLHRYGISSSTGVSANRIRKTTETKEEQINRAGKDYALFFVIGDYQEWGKLKNPVIDGEAVAGSLSDKYGFQTEVVVNPTRDQIYAQLEKYRSITFPDDGQLFVFFSGHGDFVESTGEGFLVPKEGLKSEKDRFQNSYIPHARLEKMLDAIPCRHILIALDACYSGTFDQEIAELKGETNFKRPGAGSKNAIVQRELEAQSRIYLTSGGKERTPDGVVHSPFAEKLLDALDGEGGDDGILTINELYGFLEKAAPKPRKGRFGKHDPSGTFLFIKRIKE
ncbi:MAG: caspase family protein [Lewinellaceae bacterium]|nr:caspase family protein [Lewinellaceae bacterium]